MKFAQFLIAGALSAAASHAIAAPVSVSGDPALYWNQVVLDAVRTTSTPPPAAARALAMVNTAVFDAVNAANGGKYYGYGSSYAGGVPASTRVAAATAAHAVLKQLFPSQTATFNSALAQSLALEADPAALAAGQTLGTQTAGAILAARANDGASAIVPYTPGADLGEWRPTPPNYAPAALPQWRFVTPFTMASADQFRAPPPPALDSADYAAAVNEVQELGSATSATRTADQTAIAYFWIDNAGTATPPGHWLIIAGEVAQQQGLDTLDASRLLALTSLAVADAGIAAWDTKYEYELWRPIDAIRNADQDGNDGTTLDALWTPLIATPNHPSYVSGHSTFSGAGAEILDQFFDLDFNFCSPDELDSDIVRCWNSFDAAAAEAGRSRIYGGIHYSFDDVSGQAIGNAVARNVFGNYLTQVPEPGTLALGLFGVVALGGIARRRK